MEIGTEIYKGTEVYKASVYNNIGHVFIIKGMGEGIAFLSKSFRNQFSQ
jgi:hypothetical protein